MIIIFNLIFSFLWPFVHVMENSRWWSCHVCKFDAWICTSFETRWFARFCGHGHVLTLPALVSEWVSWRIYNGHREKLYWKKYHSECQRSHWTDIMYTQTQQQQERGEKKVGEQQKEKGKVVICILLVQGESKMERGRDVFFSGTREIMMRSRRLLYIEYIVPRVFSPTIIRSKGLALKVLRNLFCLE